VNAVFSNFDRIHGIAARKGFINLSALSNFSSILSQFSKIPAQTDNNPKRITDNLKLATGIQNVKLKADSIDYGIQLPPLIKEGWGGFGLKLKTAF
jgi:hypothetical protein